MKRFSSVLLDESRDINSHMTHIEDSVIMQGVDGTRQAINYLRSLRDMLAGDTKAPVNVTVKWDGAPAIVAGIDPSDGKFFVAKKGIFNKEPKVYKSHADIDADTSGDLNEKLKLAFTHLSGLGIKDIIQGDFLYAKKDLRKVVINGESYITFHPNTIVYAVPEKSKLAKQILGSEIGVVWHTTYRGSDFESMSASFGKEIATNLSSSKKVWSVDAVYKDVSGSATMTKKETDAITKILSDAGKKFNTVGRKTFDGIIENKDLNIRVNAFINLKVREGTRIKNTSTFVTDLMNYVYEYYQKEIDKLKTERGKEGKRQKRDEIMKFFSVTPKSQIVALFDLYNLIVDAKMMIISKLNRAKSIDTLLLTPDGYRVTGQEGFVAINRLGKGAVKLVDRLEFSRANFSPDIIKGWQK